jgi:hypothetical protein
MQFTTWDIATGTVVLTDRQGHCISYRRVGKPLPRTFRPQHAIYDAHSRSWTSKSLLSQASSFPPELFLTHTLPDGTVATCHYIRDE